MHLRRFIPGAALTLIWAGQAFGFAPVPASEQLEFRLQYLQNLGLYKTVRFEDEFAGRSLSIGNGWTVRIHPRTGTAHMAMSMDGAFDAAAGSITNDAAAIQAARGVIDLAADMLGTDGSTVEPRDVSTMPGKWSVHFDQKVNGLKVYTGEAFVLMDGAGKVAAFGSDFFPAGHDLATTPHLSSSQALDAAAGALSATPRPASPATMELMYVPAPGDEMYELRLAYRVVFETDQPYGKWESIVDAMTGEILARQNYVHSINVIGTSQGDVEDFGYCDGVATKPFENQTVQVTGGNNDVTDDVGAFVITHGGALPVTVTAQFLGPFCNVNRYTGLGADASFSGSNTPGNPLIINWTNANSRADERDMFFHVNRVHDFMKAIDPTFVGLDYAAPTSVGRTDGFCPGNAWWDGNGMNFCEGTATYGNTGRIGNVAYHEYGHGVTQFVYQANGSGDPQGTGMHEGNSDILANLVDRQPIIGLGFFLNNCTGGIRNSDNNLQWPQDVNGQEDHSAGQVIAGFVWDTWQSMLLELPQNEADNAIRHMWHFSRDMGVPQDQQSQVDWSFLADDDDANQGNGTPHHEHLALGASNHGFDFLPFGVVITHAPLGSTNNGSSGFNVVANVQSTVAAIDPSSVFLHYRINGSSFVDVAMTVGNPNEYTGQIPPIAGGNSEVEYYISAADNAANEGTSPQQAPAVLHGFDVAHFADNLESGVAAWTVGAPGDNATTGIWACMDPIGTAAQPEDDATPAPGVFAFITGQCGPPQCGACDLGCNDVDNGTTTLTSPVYNLVGATSAKLKFARWYTNDTGADPNNDFWVVDVSNNGGTTWTNVENTNVPDHSWKTISVDLDALFGTLGQVRVRFKASDLASGSLVEAGVDELRILASFTPTDVNDLTASVTPSSFELAQNQPNPFSPMTRIDFAVPQKSNVSLAVFDVSGRVVRTLTDGSREAGRYAINWDGRDEAGKRVSAGVYFYRLTAAGESLTRKMTVLK